MVEPSLERGDGSTIINDHSNFKGDNNNMEELDCMAAYCRGKELTWFDYVAIIFNVFSIPAILVLLCIIAIILLTRKK